MQPSVGDPRWMLHLKDHGLEEEPEALDYGFWHTLKMCCVVRETHPLAQEARGARGFAPRR